MQTTDTAATNRRHLRHFGNNAANSRLVQVSEACSRISLISFNSILCICWCWGDAVCDGVRELIINAAQIQLTQSFLSSSSFSLRYLRLGN